MDNKRPANANSEDILYKELETVFEFSYDPIYVVDGDGILLRLNPACSRFYGFPPEHLIGKSIHELEKMNALSPLAAKKALQSGMRITMTETTKTNREIFVTATPVMNEEDKVVRVVCNLRDLTELMRLKLKMEEAERVKREYETKLLEVASNQEQSIVLSSPGIRQSFEMGLRVAKVDSTVLILGESGVGKNVLARYIHDNSMRKNEPFVEINCASFSESLLESELFGYAAGAFTGAKKEGRIGHLEMANKGTIFFDEIGEMPNSLQVKLLHFLQSRYITRVGGSTPLPLDVRVIAATNRDIEEMVKAGQFREDLYYRLNVVPITLPPLRERREDITSLIMHFLLVYKRRYGIGKILSPDALDKLIKYDWPGNVRELQNIVERLVVTSVKETISLSDLPDYIRDSDSVQKHPNRLQDYVEEIEAEKILSTYEKYMSTYKAAKALGMSQSSFSRKLRRYRQTKK